MFTARRVVSIAWLPMILCLITEQAGAWFDKPYLVNFRNESGAPVDVLITSPVPEFIGRLRVNEAVEVDFNRGEVVEIRQNGQVLKRVTITKSGTERILRPGQSQPQRPPAGPPAYPKRPNNPTLAPPPPPGMAPRTGTSNEARKLADYLNQIRANPAAFARLHPTLADPDVQTIHALKWNDALQKAAERKAQWMVQTGQFTHTMDINGQTVGMNKWMREAGYTLDPLFDDAVSNFECLFGAGGSAPLANIGTRSIDSFMSEGKDGGHVVPLLGRTYWKPCTDIGAAIASAPDGMQYIVVLVGYSPDSPANPPANPPVTSTPGAVPPTFPGPPSAPAMQNPPIGQPPVVRRSLRSDVQVTVTWKNSDSQPVTLHWVDGNGQETSGLVMQPGQQLRAFSFETHVFVFRKNNREIRTVTLTNQSEQTYEIGEPGPITSNSPSVRPPTFPDQAPPFPGQTPPFPGQSPNMVPKQAPSNPVTPPPPPPTVSNPPPVQGQPATSVPPGQIPPTGEPQTPVAADAQLVVTNNSGQAVFLEITSGKSQGGIPLANGKSRVISVPLGTSVAAMSASGILLRELTVAKPVETLSL